MKKSARFTCLTLALALSVGCGLCACAPSGNAVPSGSALPPVRSEAPALSAAPAEVPSSSPAVPAEITLAESARPGQLCFARRTYRYLGQDVSRLYYYYIPSDYQSGERLPLMVSLHGSGSSATLNRLETDYVRYAEDERFIVVFPESVYIHKDGKLSSEGKSYLETKQSDYSYLRWNAASTDPVAGYRVDDVQYISDLIDAFVDGGWADSARVYASGMSHGGFLCLRMALEIPEKLAGVGAVSALLCAEYLQKALPEDGPKVVLINGTEDAVVPITGMVYDFDRDGEYEYTWAVSQEESAAWFLDRYGVENAPEVTALPDADPGDGTSITRYAYRDGSGEERVVRYVVEGGGHTWPGGNLDYGAFGRSSRDAQGAALIWDELRDAVNEYRTPEEQAG